MSKNVQFLKGMSYTFGDDEGGLKSDLTKTRTPKQHERLPAVTAS